MAVFTWNHHPGLVDEVLVGGVAGYLGKNLTAAQLGRALRASPAEVAANPRARSATLRVAERTAAALPGDWSHEAAASRRRRAARGAR